MAQRRIGVAAQTKRNSQSIRVLREKERRKKPVRHRHPALDQRRVASRRNISARKKRPRIDRANEQDAQPRLHVAPPCVSRVTVTSERAHNHQPSIHLCLSNCSQLPDREHSEPRQRRNATPAKQNNRTCTVRGHACHAYRRAGSSQQPASPQYLSNCS